MIPKQAQGLLDILHAFKDENMFRKISQFNQHEFRCILYNHFEGGQLKSIFWNYWRTTLQK